MPKKSHSQQSQNLKILQKFSYIILLFVHSGVTGGVWGNYNEFFGISSYYLRHFGPFGSVRLVALSSQKSSLEEEVHER